jgi:hypothetical protein
MTTYELETQVFHYIRGYFDEIGHDRPEVVEFRRLVENRDLRGLRLHWGRLEDSFIRLEPSRGMCRPLIADYYWTYSQALVELCKRQVQAMTTTALEESVFRYEAAYFDRIGSDDCDVREFKTLVERRDLRGMRQRWASLVDSFNRLEREQSASAVVSFREFYYLHFESLVELCMRRGV